MNENRILYPVKVICIKAWVKIGQIISNYIYCFLEQRLIQSNHITFKFIKQLVVPNRSLMLLIPREFTIISSENRTEQVFINFIDELPPILLSDWQTG